ncbi:MAG: hypothetical protein ACPIA7_07685 [Akkermansiaceae bacterium]
MQNHPLGGNAVAAPKKKDNTIAIIVSYVVLGLIMAYVIFDQDEPVAEVVIVPKIEKPAEKVVLNPVAASIVLSEPLWVNPPEDMTMSELEEMMVKFQMTNHNAYPVTEVKVKFSFYDILDNNLPGAVEKTVDEVIEASGEITVDDFVLGEYPRDTISIKAEVLAVSAAEE